MLRWPIQHIHNKEKTMLGKFILWLSAIAFAAYGVAWVATLLYLWSIWRRLQKVDRELAEVSRRVAERLSS